MNPLLSRVEKSLVKAVKRKRSQDVFQDDLDLTFDDLRFRKSYCQEVNDHLVRQSTLDNRAYPFFTYSQDPNTQDQKYGNIQKQDLFSV